MGWQDQSELVEAPAWLEQTEEVVSPQVQLARETPAGEAFLVGLGSGVGSTWRGTEQLLSEYVGSGQSAQEIAADTKAVRALERESKAAFAGELLGNALDPIGWLIPAGKAATILQMAKMGAKFGAVGGVLGPTEELGAEGLKERALGLGAGAVLGGVFAGILGSLLNAGRAVRGKELIPWIKEPEVMPRPELKQPGGPLGEELPTLRGVPEETPRLPEVAEEAPLPALRERVGESVPRLPGSFEPIRVPEPLPTIEKIAEERPLDIFSPAGSAENPLPFHFTLPEGPRTRPVEVTPESRLLVLPEERTVLDSAIAKQKNGQEFLLSAEEKIALSKIESEMSGPKIALDYDAIGSPESLALTQQGVRASALAHLGNGSYRGALGEIAKLEPVSNQTLSFWGKIANRLLENPHVDPKSVEIKPSLKGARGLYRYADGGMEFSLQHADLETILHEGTHYVGNRAIIAEFAGKGELLTPAERTGAQGLLRQFRAVTQDPKAQLAIEQAFVQHGRVRGESNPFRYGQLVLRTIQKNPAEFFAYGSTNPFFQKVLREIPLENSTAWQKMSNSWREMLGLEPKFQTQLDDFLWNANLVVKESKGLAPGFDIPRVAKNAVGKLSREAGFASPEIMVRLAATGGGAVAGAVLNPKNPLEGALMGAAVGLGVSGAGIKVAQGLLTRGLKSPQAAAEVAPRLARQTGKNIQASGVHELIKDWDYRAKANERSIAQAYALLKKVAPTQEANEKLLFNLDTGASPGDPAVRTAKALFDSVWQKAHDAGVVKNYVENYVTHLYDWGTQKGSSALVQLRNMIEQDYAQGLKTKTPFDKGRVFKTYQLAAEKAGLEPLTTDVAQIYGIHARSMLEASNNAQLIKGIKDLKGIDGEPLVTTYSAGEFPAGFTTVNHPQWRGYAVSKSIAPELIAMFAADNPFLATRLAHGVSLAAKKGIFMLSGFHFKSLAEAAMGAIRNPRAVVRAVDLLKMYRQGGAGDIIDTALRGGLEVGHGTLDTANRGLWDSVVKSSTRLMDSIVPGGGMLVKAPVKVEEAWSKALWEQFHPMLKLSVWEQEFQRLMRKRPDLGTEAASEMAARFSNDIFGGQDWLRNALVVQGDVARRFMLEAASPQGRRAMQIGLLAPDWLVSTFRAYTGAFRRGVDPAERAMYQKYLAQSFFLYGVIGDALNMHFTGHHFWENRDPDGKLNPTVVDMGDGRKLWLSKHLMEVPHWVMDPGGTALNKLGYIPKEIFTQLQNKEWLSTKGAPNIVPEGTSFAGNVGYRFVHALKGFVPISLQEYQRSGAEAALLGAAGVPIRGKSFEEQARLKAERQRQRELKKLRGE